MRQEQDTGIAEIMEQVINGGADEMGSIFVKLIWMKWNLWHCRKVV